MKSLKWADDFCSGLQVRLKAMGLRISRFSALISLHPKK